METMHTGVFVVRPDSDYSAFEMEGFAHLRETVEKVIAEFDHIATKYPDQRLSMLSHVAVITEEWGESVEGILKKNYDEAQKEIAQTIACLIRLSHEIERVKLGKNVSEAHLYKEAQ